MDQFKESLDHANEIGVSEMALLKKNFLVQKNFPTPLEDFFLFKENCFTFEECFNYFQVFLGCVF